MSQNIQINMKLDNEEYEIIFPETKTENIIDLNEKLDVRYLQLTGGTITGTLNVATPIESTQAVNKKYVDDVIGDIGDILDSINGEVI